MFETRTGRCGEWANAFTSICIALGLEARLILDWTDHVWTEVFIYEWNRWVHLDSCEEVMDQPLLYEKGWGKQLTYCIGFSSQEIVDVSKRYVLDNLMNRLRRDKVNEKWLEDKLKTMRESLWEMQGPGRIDMLRARYQEEVRQLNLPKDE